MANDVIYHWDCHILRVSVRSFKYSASFVGTLYYKDMFSNSDFAYHFIIILIFNMFDQLAES